MLSSLISALESQLRASGDWPPPDGWAPDSPEGRELLAAEPFTSFRIHPLPEKIQAFLDAHPDLDTGERDAVAELLENVYHIQPPFFIVNDGLDLTFWLDKEPPSAP